MKPAAVNRERSKIAIFLHSGEYDRLHQGLSIAAAAVASARPVEIFCFWWALERLARGRLDEPDFAPAREDIVERFEAKSVPTLRSLLGLLRESEHCAIYACTGSMAIAGLAPELVERSVGQMLGWTTILQLTSGVTDRFYL